MENYFSEKELMCKCGCKTYNFDKDFLDKLNHIRYNVGQPLIVTSGCRCKEHNKKVGGTEESSHTKGLAVDISCSDSVLRSKIIKQAINFGITASRTVNFLYTTVKFFYIKSAPPHSFLTESEYYIVWHVLCFFFGRRFEYYEYC